MKKCNKCNIEKPLTKFYKNKNSKDGVAYKCKSCSKSMMKDYWEDNPNYMKEWRNKNTTHVKEYYKSWRNQNQISIHTKELTYQQQRRKTDPLFRLSKLIRVHVNRFLNGYKHKKTQDVVGCSFDELYVHLLLTLPITHRFNYIHNPKLYEVDHIIPLSWAQDEESIYELNHYSNLQLLLKEENRRKSNKPLEL